MPQSLTPSAPMGSPALSVPASGFVPGQPAARRPPVQRRARLEPGLDLPTLLIQLGLEKYTARFLAEEVVIENLPHLTREDYKELGLPLGPRTTLWAFFNEPEM